MRLPSSLLLLLSSLLPRRCTGPSPRRRCGCRAVGVLVVPVIPVRWCPCPHRCRRCGSARFPSFAPVSTPQAVARGGGCGGTSSSRCRRRAHFVVVRPRTTTANRHCEQVVIVRHEVPVPVASQSCRPPTIHPASSDSQR
jgi:hypothetical protein